MTASSLLYQFPSSPNTPARSKLSVTFNDPPLQKHGGLVTKVQCRMLDRRDVVCREDYAIDGIAAIAIDGIPLLQTAGRGNNASSIIEFHIMKRR